jgi:hypothetical protein
MAPPIPVSSPAIPAQPPGVVTVTDRAVAAARSGAQLLANFQQVNPALAEQLTGSVATYSKSGAAPLVGAAIGWGAAHYGLMCSASTAAVAGCWTDATVTLVTAICIAAGTALSAGGMHWLAKAPARAALASSPAPPASEPPKGSSL